MKITYNNIEFTIEGKEFKSDPSTNSPATMNVTAILVGGVDVMEVLNDETLEALDLLINCELN